MESTQQKISACSCWAESHATAAGSTTPCAISSRVAPKARITRACATLATVNPHAPRRAWAAANWGAMVVFRCGANSMSWSAAKVAYRSRLRSTAGPSSVATGEVNPSTGTRRPIRSATEVASGGRPLCRQSTGSSPRAATAASSMITVRTLIGTTRPKLWPESGAEATTAPKLCRRTGRSRLSRHHVDLDQDVAELRADRRPDRVRRGDDALVGGVERREVGQVGQVGGHLHQVRQVEPGHGEGALDVAQYRLGLCRDAVRYVPGGRIVRAEPGGVHETVRDDHMAVGAGGLGQFGACQLLHPADPAE